MHKELVVDAVLRWSSSDNHMDAEWVKTVISSLEQLSSVSGAAQHAELYLSLKKRLGSR